MPYTFSNRMGITVPPEMPELNKISSNLRTSIWNLLYKTIYDDYLYNRNYYDSLIMETWDVYLKLRVNNMYTSHKTNIDVICNWFFNEKTKYYDIFNLIEHYLNQSELQEICEELEFLLNDVFEREYSGYRIINKLIVPIVNDIQINEIRNAFYSKHKAVSKHIETALLLLSNRDNPDYRNSIKESISAIESLSKILTNDPNAMLNRVISKLSAKHSIHPQFSKAIECLYNYTSDKSGIRHGIFDSIDTLKFEDSLFMLSICSSFINYLEIKNIDTE
jgi:AbiJ N-terminal domain 4